jgi:Na+-transporting methylmalonyl-CoA/oxaloacetate decarboxylase gamma subunit
MRIVGLVLIVLGILAFVYGGISYTKHEEVLEVGSLRATVEEKKHIPIPPIAGGAAILAGIILVSRRPQTA